MSEDPKNPDNTPEDPDYDGMTDEQLEEALAKGGGPVVPSEEEPEQPASEPDAETAPEAPADESPADPVEEAPADAPAEEPEFNEQESQIEELRLQLQQQKQERERASFQRDREAGTVGSLKQELESIKALLANRQDDLEGDDGVEAAKAPAPAFRDSRVDDIEQDRKQQRIATAFKEFIDKVGDDTRKDLEAAANGEAVTAEAFAAEHEARIKAMTPRIQEQAAVYKDESFNIKAAEKATRMACDAGYLDWQLERVRNLRAAASKKQASQVSSKKREKMAASVSGSGSSAPSASHKLAENMSADEADAALVREFGSGQRRYRR
jgi:hypothetical protein